METIQHFDINRGIGVVYKLNLRILLFAYFFTILFMFCGNKLLNQMKFVFVSELHLGKTFSILLVAEDFSHPLIGYYSS